MNTFYVYKIVVNEVVRYIGHTNDITKRELQHNKNCFNLKSKISNRKFYKFYRENSTEPFKLIKIKEFSSKVDAKRYECLLILNDYFGDKLLKQKVPNISDM